MSLQGSELRARINLEFPATTGAEARLIRDWNAALKGRSSHRNCTRP